MGFLVQSVRTIKPPRAGSSNAQGTVPSDAGPSQPDRQSRLGPIMDLVWLMALSLSAESRP